LELIWPRLDTPGVLAAVRELFSGNEELTEGFNVFLPPGYHIPLTADTPSNSAPERTPPPPPPAATTTPIHQARNFVIQVKARTTPGHTSTEW
jgi:histone deacetylase complex regulatory component SIN3